MQKIMIIDDEIDILSMLDRYFRLNGYSVITANSAAEAQNKLSMQPDLILLDINMPEMDGISFCRNIRDYVSCPILFLTANTDDRNKISGFSAGGDDYIVKPFSVEELGARVSAHLRRENRAKTKAQILFDSNFVIDFSQRVVFFKNKEIPFTKKEFDIIEILSQNPGQVFDKERLYEAAWGIDGLETIPLLQNTLAKYVQNLLPLVQDSILRLYGEWDINGQNKGQNAVQAYSGICYACGSLFSWSHVCSRF